MKTSYKFFFLCLLLATAMMQSCNVNSNRMFKEVKNEEGKITYDLDSIPMFPTEDYRISADDKIMFTLATNNGTEIIEKLSGISREQGVSKSGTSFTVRGDGFVKLPVIGDTKVAGLTIKECEDTLVSKYSKEYKDPFIQVSVTNQRVIVFTGNGSDATVVPLTNSNTTALPWSSTIPFRPG